MTAPVASSMSQVVALLVQEAERSERARSRELARRHYESALYLLRSGEGVTAATITRRVARTYIDEGQFDAALDTLTGALAIADALDSAIERAHAMNLIAIAHAMRGDMDEAEVHWAAALAHARDAYDERLAAMISQNLGNIASVRGDFPAALNYYGSSLATFRSTQLFDHLPAVLNNMGLVYTQLDRLDEAQQAYDEALMQCETTGDVSHRLLALINSTELWLARGDMARASSLCETVLSEASAASDQRALGETYKYLGVIARSRGALDDADAYLSKAFVSASQREDLLLAAETSREQAELFEQMGKNRDTLQALSRSHKLFAKLRAQRNLADLKKRIGRLETRFYDIVTNWAHNIESKDVYTLGHCERVADYACAIARDVGYDDITMFWFRVGALLHDVGKIVVPSEILNKPGPLTPDERLTMEQHAAAGSDLLREVDFPWDVLPLVRGHHERWDGRGYPDRLAGEAIALSARIVCVADVFDALTTDRPYRRGFSFDQALEIMAKDSGKMFDPDLFARFEHIVRHTSAFPEPHREPIALAS